MKVKETRTIVEASNLSIQSGFRRRSPSLRILETSPVPSCDVPGAVPAVVLRPKMQTNLLVAGAQGDQTLVRWRLTSRADINAAPAELQAVSADGQNDMVAIPVHAWAKVNSLSPQVSRRTALQAATKNGHCQNTTTPVHPGAHIMTLSAQRAGRTTPQAAAGCGYVDIVGLRVNNDTETSAPAAESEGLTALQAAAD